MLKFAKNFFAPVSSWENLSTCFVYKENLTARFVHEKNIVIWSLHESNLHEKPGGQGFGGSQYAGKTASVLISCLFGNVPAGDKNCLPSPAPPENKSGHRFRYA